MSDAYKNLVQAMADDEHAKVETSASAILEIQSSDKTLGAIKAKLLSLIKKRDFAAALQFLNKNDYTKKNCQVEAAYILHRQD